MRRPRSVACWVIPSTQAAKPSSTRPAAVPSTPDEPASWLTTQTSQALAPYIGKASACRSTSIQRPGFGVRRAQRRHGGQHGIGRGQAQPHHQEHQHRHRRRRGQAGGDRDAHERRGAGRRDHHRQQAGEEAAELPLARRQALARVRSGRRRPGRRRTGSARPRTAARPSRRRTPATGTGSPSPPPPRPRARPAAPRPGRRTRPARRRYRRRPAQRAPPRGVPASPTAFMRQHRKHARHQVQDQPAEERQAQHALEPHRWRRRRHGAGSRAQHHVRLAGRCGRAPTGCLTGHPRPERPWPASAPG